jgi:GWxTD domain-containing protein
MNRFIRIIYSTSLFLVFIISGLLAQDPDEIRDAYQAAKMKSMDRKWTEAISLFDEFLEKYPGSKYEDGVLFWTGYSQEQIPGQSREAFNTYSTLVNNYPNSTWVDDALGHQITLAEQFVLEGQDSFKEFLYQQMRKEQKEYQYRSAIALGKIGDKKALPVLEKMKNDEDYGNMAIELIAVLSTERIPIDDESRRVIDKKKMDLVYDKEQVKPEEEDPKGIMVFDTERYKQYSSMLRKDDDWSREELVDFALWHILDTDEFKGYTSLASEFDKEEWRRKYWKRKDPTPTTKENQIEEEFQRRIDHSRGHFADFWNYSSFKYLTDQHLRLGWFHAPWDARGELYIKYGEPDFRSVEGFHQEVWTYNRYSVDFLVKQYMTNIYGNAITAGEMSYRVYGSIGGRIRNFDHLNPLSSAQRLNETLWNNVNIYVQANFIFNQEIRYAYNYNADPIENIQLFLDLVESKDKKRVIFRYQLPVDEFELVSQPGGLEVRYKEVYCVLDEDLREVAKHEIIRRIGNIPNDDFKFEESILLNLPEGKYTLHLRIEDQNADNLGIFSHEFEVKDL